jgi:3-methylcrotonyl-CoA carboxylase beta subunit
MACESIMIDRSSFSFLGGPPLVKMATGETITAEDLGGARVHTHVSGGADHYCLDQAEAVATVRNILSLEAPQTLHLHQYQEQEPEVPAETIYDHMPINSAQGIDARSIINCLADGSVFQEYKKNYAPGKGSNIITGRARIKGFPVGIVASNGVGIIFYEAARKAAEWVVRCSNEKIPLIFIQNSPGFMVGSESEHAGIGKYGSDLVRAVSCAQVPRIQLVIGPDNGAANYGMCGRAYKPNFLLSIEEAKRKHTGTPMTEEEKEAFRQKMIDKYDGEAHPFYCGARLLSDRVLKFSEIRDWLGMAVEVSVLKPIGEPSFGNFRF